MTSLYTVNLINFKCLGLKNTNFEFNNLNMQFSPWTYLLTIKVDTSDINIVLD